MPFNKQTYFWETPKNRGHVWKTEEDGDVDIFAYQLGDVHNGPECINCGYGFCHHCQDTVGRECSAPKTSVETDWQHCSKCGELFTGRGGQYPFPPELSCPNGHRWPDPNGWSPDEVPRVTSKTASKP